MGFVEEIIAVFGTRKLSTSKDYKLLSQEIAELEKEMDDIRVMLWAMMTPEQKEQFKKYAEYRRKHRN